MNSLDYADPLVAVGTAIARRPPLHVPGKGRVLVFSFGSVTSGIPHGWAATADRPGVDLLRGLSEADALKAADRIARIRQPGDLVVVSLHWGPNWGYDIPEQQQLFARTLIDKADVSVVHGHSSHHAKAVEVYRKRLILYGCGDFLNDYEGIRGYEEYRGDVSSIEAKSLANRCASPAHRADK